MHKRFSLFVIFLFAVSLILVGGPNTIKGKPAKVSDEIIIKFAPDATEAQKTEILNKYGLLKKRNSKKKGAFVVFKHGNPTAILNSLKKEKGIIYAEQNAYAYAFNFVPNDPYYSYQWHMTRIGMEKAWELSQGEGVVVAIIDTGVKQSLEDLSNTNFTTGYDFVNDDNDPTDDEGHGSHVCGTIAQSTNNGVGVTGIAYKATIMPVKVLDRRGSGSYDDIADGIYYAVDHGADIINMSLGGSTDLQVLEDAVNYAWEHGVVVVCAAGNENTSEPSYPAAYENAISVAATTSIDTRASYSNYGSTIDIAAPGGDSGDNNGDGYDDMILQNTFGSSGDGYYFYAGTSMASPHVAGVAALVKAANPSLTNVQIRQILESTAEDLGDTGWDQYFGYGLVDAYAAVLEAIGGSGGGGDEDTTPPTISGVNATNITTNSATIVWTTNENADSVVYYGTTTSYGNTASDSSYVTSHSIDLTGLPAGTVIHYKVVSTDEAGNTSESGDYTFTTQEEEEPGASYMYVYNIDMWTSSRGRNLYGNAEITIMDSDGNPVSNATVYVTWSGAVNSTDSGVTGSDGKVTFTSPRVKAWSGTFTITVTNVTHASIPYDFSKNVETSDTVSK